jgi:hypothetical protein
MDFIKWFLGTSVFGTIIGFCLGKFGSKWDEERKAKKEGHQLLRNLLQEVGANRFKAEAILGGHDPVYFEVFSWDVVKLNKYLQVLAKDKPVLDAIYFLYLLIYQTNLRVATAHAALDSIIRNPSQQAGNMGNLANQTLKDYINASLLPKLKEVEMALRIFLQKERVL